jgi:hypothetical protein
MTAKLSALWSISHQWAHADQMKALRYAMEGDKAPNALPGNEVVPKGQLSPWEIALRAAGITPQSVADQNDVNSAEQNVKTAIEQREMQIIRRYAVADAHDDNKETGKALDELNEFAKANPGVPIRKDLIGYIRSKARAEHGSSLPMGLQGIRQNYEGDAALQQQDQ